MALVGQANAHDFNDLKNHDKSDISTIVPVINSRGETSKISIIYNETYEAYRRQKGSLGFFDEFFYGYNYDLSQDLEVKFIEGGIKTTLARRMAKNIAKRYSSSNYITGHDYPIYSEESFFDFILGSPIHWSPSAKVFDQKGKYINLHENSQVSVACSIIGLSDSFNGEAWLASFLFAHGNHFDFPEENGKEFAAFVKYHEIAHCMGADERLADYVAAKIYLKNHEDPSRAMKFLDLVKSLRLRNNIIVNSPKRYGDFFAIEQAMEEYKDGLIFNESNKKIWSQALIKNDFSKDIIAKAKYILFNHDNDKLKSALNDRRFDDADDIIRNVGQTVSPEYKFVFNAFSKAMQTLNREVIPLAQADLIAQSHYIHSHP